MKYTYSHTTGKRIQIDDAMIDLRNRLLPAFGYVLRRCTLGPSSKGLHRMCVERDDMTSEFKGNPCSTFHARYDDNEMHWPDEVMKAAHAIDKSKPAKATK